MVHVLLIDLIITLTLKATVTFTFRSSIPPTMEVGLGFGFMAKFKQYRLAPSDSCECKNISVGNKLWVRIEISDLPHVNAA